MPGPHVVGFLIAASVAVIGATIGIWVISFSAIEQSGVSDPWRAIFEVGVTVVFSVILAVQVALQAWWFGNIVVLAGAEHGAPTERTPLNGATEQTV